MFGGDRKPFTEVLSSASAPFSRHRPGTAKSPRKSQRRDFKRMSSGVENLLAPGLKRHPPPPSAETGKDQWRRPEWGEGDPLKQ